MLFLLVLFFIILPLIGLVFNALVALFSLPWTNPYRESVLTGRTHDAFRSPFMGSDGAYRPRKL